MLTVLQIFFLLQIGYILFCFRELLIMFYKSTGGYKPHRIILYRDGVSEGQFLHVSILYSCLHTDVDYTCIKFNFCYFSSFLFK